MVTNNVNTLQLRKCSRDEFVAAITDDKADGFAKTFRAKADMQEQWDECLGAFSDDGELMGAIITTLGALVKICPLLKLMSLEFIL